MCRWISPDSIEYLDPESINGLNLYAYCGNDPINKHDPSGHFAISILAWIIIGAALTTAVAVTYGAIKEETIVLDLSYSIPNKLKMGGSLVLDFKGKNIEIYPHVGQAYGISSGLSYSIGKVWNYSKPGSYSGFFAFGGGGYLIGFDGCFNPLKPSGASATSITFSTSASLYGGWDWYFGPISFNYERWEFNKIQEED